MIKSRPYSTHRGDTFSVSAGNSESMRLLSRPRRRCEDNIKIDFKHMRICTDLFGLGQGRMTGSYEHGNECSIPVKRGGFLG